MNVRTAEKGLARPVSVLKPIALFIFCALLAVCAEQAAGVQIISSELQTTDQQEAPAKLIPGLGSLHHPIATKSPEAQKFFDQGITLFYAFNFNEAVRSFTRASQLDPQAAMPFWGLALAMGPSYNGGTYVSPANEKAAYEALQKATKLAASGPAVEQDYIAALSRLFSSDSNPDLAKLGRDYVSAARDLSLRYPDDPDAATLYAASLMDLHTRALWTNDGKPGEDTLEVVAVLERVLRLWPEHAGANHFYIHLMEASPFPECALPSAHRLETLVPAAGHLIHMPAHIYVRTGDYAAAVKSNEAAIAVDQDYLRDLAPSDMAYRFGYVEHDLSFLIFAADMDGEFDTAFQTASELEAQGRALIEQIPYVEQFLASALLVQIRYARWDAILALAAPGEKLKGMTFFWHYARGCAFAAKGQAEQANGELDAMEQSYRGLSSVPPFGMNSWGTLHEMAAHSLQARISAARGDYPSAVEHWRAAIAAEDNMIYHEPPDWFYPMRESLGAALLRGGQPAEAEKVFREDLDRNPRNPRSLFGLWKALEAEHKPADAEWARSAFEEAWKGGANGLRLEDF